MCVTAKSDELCIALINSIELCDADIALPSLQTSQERMLVSEIRKYNALAASLSIAGLAFTGCSSTDDVIATLDDSVPDTLPDDGGLDDGSDRTTGGVFSTA